MLKDRNPLSADLASESVQKPSSSNEYINENLPKYYNSHCLYVSSGCAHPEQLIKSMKAAIKSASKVLDRSVNCSFKVNLVIGRNEHYYGFGWIWVTNEEIYHMLLGRNPDGTRRVQVIEDPDWKCPIIPIHEALEEIDHIKSWADYCDEEDKITERYKPGVIELELPPLITLPDFIYTKEQLDLINSDTTNTTSQPDKGSFYLSPAVVQE